MMESRSWTAIYSHSTRSRTIEVLQGFIHIIDFDRFIYGANRAWMSDRQINMVRLNMLKDGLLSYHINYIFQVGKQTRAGLASSMRYIVIFIAKSTDYYLYLNIVWLQIYVIHS